ncbi:hypothetical protein JB92DRAFT_2829429 [Gautieria morchelliformis]|nr:hypothetical protein JB92DRAFT_2829429 [Gautieria morchelliformis]
MPGASTSSSFPADPDSTAFHIAIQVVSGIAQNTKRQLRFRTGLGVLAPYPDSWLTSASLIVWKLDGSTTARCMASHRSPLQYALISSHPEHFNKGDPNLPAQRDHVLHTPSKWKVVLTMLKSRNKVIMASSRDEIKPFVHASGTPRISAICVGTAPQMATPGMMPRYRHLRYNGHAILSKLSLLRTKIPCCLDLCMGPRPCGLRGVLAREGGQGWLKGNLYPHSQSAIRLIDPA